MPPIDSLPPLREVVRKHELAPKKSLGQNFLFDLNLTSRIARASGTLQGVTVVEIGPGPGGLTRALLAEGAAHVVAVERDSRAIAALHEIAEAYPDRLTILEGDALTLDLGTHLPQGPKRIVANLPYNIGTQLLLNWITDDPWPPWWESLTLMFQREVAERIVADETDRKNYGRLGVLCGWRCQSRILFDVAPSAFVPPPKVTSSVVHLTPRSTPSPVALKSLEAITQAAFGQRRKMLRQSLKSLMAEPQRLIEAAGLQETMRAEEVDVASYVKMAQALNNM